jgi:hypothetical protein
MYSCPNTTTDVDGALFDRAGRYTIRFASERAPNVKGFWSLTMYDATFNLTRIRSTGIRSATARGA